MSKDKLPHSPAETGEAKEPSQDEHALATGPLTPEQMRLTLLLERFSKDPFSDEHRVCQG
jgi:hypothetical protein